MKTFRISSTNLELTAIGAVCVFSQTSNGKINHFANIIPGIKVDAENNLHKVETLATIYKTCFQVATNSAKLANLFETFAKYGVFVPNSAKYHLFGAMRKAVNNSIWICTEISAVYVDDKNIEKIDYTFAPLFVSEIALSETALMMRKKTIDAVEKLTKVSQWNNAARGILCQFNVLSIRTDIENGKPIVLDKLEPETETAEITDNSAVA